MAVPQRGPCFSVRFRTQTMTVCEVCAFMPELISGADCERVQMVSIRMSEIAVWPGETVTILKFSGFILL